MHLLIRCGIISVFFHRPFSFDVTLGWLLGESRAGWQEELRPRFYPSNRFLSSMSRPQKYPWCLRPAADKRNTQTSDYRITADPPGWTLPAPSSAWFCPIGRDGYHDWLHGGLNAEVSCCLPHICAINARRPS